MPKLAEFYKINLSMTKKIQKKINLGIFGYGHMGQAIFKLLRPQPEINFFINSLGIKKIANAGCLNDLNKLIEKCDIIFLCLKPQEFYNLKPAALNDKIFISIMAGVKIKNIKKIINSQKIIRVMPNLALQVGAGVIAWFTAEKELTKKQLSLIKKLLSGFGFSFKVNEEPDLDKITAISGSGPAYVFLFMDALIKSAVNLGFSIKQAEAIILKLLEGSIKYYQTVNNIYTPEKLIKMVKSKKGTTEAALDKLNTTKFYKQWLAAVNAAHKRAKQLSRYEIS